VVLEFADMVPPPDASVMPRPEFSTNVAVVARVPELNVNEFVVAPRLLSAPMLTVPLLINVLPVKVLEPPNINVPLPDAVNDPLDVPAIIPLYVRVVFGSAEIVPPPAFKVMPRLGFSVKLAVVSNVPPPKTKLLVVVLLGAVPILSSALILKAPPLIVVDPK
jgi:hypothetical protein